MLTKMIKKIVHIRNYDVLVTIKRISVKNKGFDVRAFAKIKNKGCLKNEKK